MATPQSTPRPTHYARSSKRKAGLLMSLVGGLLVFVSATLFIFSFNQPKPVVDVYRIEIHPVELFTGDLKRIQPHLGLTTGCVKLDMHQPQKLTVGLEVWKNGIRNNHGSHTTPGIPSGTEISISLKSIGTGDKEQFNVITSLVGNNLKSTDTTIIDQLPMRKDANFRWGYVADLGGTVEIPENEPVYVWGYVVGHNNPCGTPQDRSIAEQVKTAEWALVLTVERAKD